MIDIKDKSQCCGCSACAQVCPKRCVSMQVDNEGFLYPYVSADDCINCGACEKVCHELNPYDEQKPIKVLAAINKNESIRMDSSSGGIFYVLANKVIDEGGIVFGARFDERWQVVIDYSEDIAGVKAFMGSKYVQARTENSYYNAQKFLKQGRKVLFSGTPCQIAGLKHYLRKDYENLLTVDFVCHGTPSPKVWSMYLSEVVARVKNIRSIKFRSKANGWKKFGFSLSYDKSDKTYSLSSPASENHYMKAFLQDIILRPSCYSCKAKSGRSHSDVTIADFWGIGDVFPEMDDDKGVGMVFINTMKGFNSLNMNEIKTNETEYDKVRHLNTACYKSSIPHPKREEFFRRIDKENSIVALIKSCTKLSIWQSFRKRLGQCKYIIMTRLVNGGGKRCSDEKNIAIEQVKKQIHNSLEVVSVCFRSKKKSWKGYDFEIQFIYNENAT